MWSDLAKFCHLGAISRHWLQFWSRRCPKWAISLHFYQVFKSKDKLKNRYDFGKSLKVYWSFVNNITMLVLINTIFTNWFDALVVWTSWLEVKSLPDFGHTVSSTSASRPVLFNFWPPVVQSSVHSGLKLLRVKFVIRAEICFDCIQSSNRSKNADSSFCVSSINFPFRVNKKFF